MKSSSRKLLICASIAIASGLSEAHGQVYDLQRLDDSIVVNVTDARPLSAALQLLSEQHPLSMTYEDPRYVYDADIQDVTLSVRTDLDQFDNPSEAPRILIPRFTTLSAYIPISKNAASAQEWLDATQVIVDVQNRSGSGGRFRVEEVDKVIHVIPIASRDENGIFTDQSAILDTRITVERQELSGLSMLTTICEAVSISAGGTFSLEPDAALASLLKPRRVPVGMLSGHQGILEATDEPARNVIMRMLRETNDTLVWQVFVTFDPKYDNYWINIRGVLGNEQATPVGESQDSLPTEPSEGSSGFSIPTAERANFFRQFQESGATTPTPPPSE